MKVKIVSVHGKGNYENEYVFLRVEESCDIGHYVLADSTYTPAGTVSNKLRHTFWFPDKKVSKGEVISVWTKPGKDTTGTTTDGQPVHRFFWGLNRAVWNDDGDCAVLLEVNSWQFFKT